MSQQSSSKSGQRNMAEGRSQETPNTGTATAREMADQVKETAGQVADQAQQTAGQVVDQARQQVASRVAGQKDRAAEGLNSVAQALRQTGEQLREQDQQNVTAYIDRAASQVERISTYLQDNDLGQLVDDVERFARRQPALFLGGAFVLGLLGARFLKSSRPYTEPSGAYTTGGMYPQRRDRGYAGERSGRGTNVGPNYQYGTGSTGYSSTGRPLTEEAPAFNSGARSYDQRREE
jgi:hypothetical protein